MPMPVWFEDSAEFRWLNKPVEESKLLDDMSDAMTWQIQGQAKGTFLKAGPPLNMPALRIEMQMFRGQPPPTRNGLSAVNVNRAFPGDDWCGYNRIRFGSAAPEVSAGSFRAYVPDGRYTVRSGGQPASPTALQGGTYRLDLRPGHDLDFDIKAVAGANGEMKISLSASGSGRHRLELRSENLDVDSAPNELSLEPRSKSNFTWKARHKSAHQPGVAVVITDNDIWQRRDLVWFNP